MYQWCYPARRGAAMAISLENRLCGEIATVKHRNLAQRLPKPALGNGRVQKLARRALTVLETATTSEVMRWTRCRGPVRHHDYPAARRALRQVGAERVGRSKAQGRPSLWRLRNTNENLTLSRVAGLRYNF